LVLRWVGVKEMKSGKYKVVPTGYWKV
jgi:hypothetical protein